VNDTLIFLVLSIAILLHNPWSLALGGIALSIAIIGWSYLARALFSALICGALFFLINGF
jgi:hypothetical protein